MLLGTLPLLGMCLEPPKSYFSTDRPCLGCIMSFCRLFSGLLLQRLGLCGFCPFFLCRVFSCSSRTALCTDQRIHCQATPTNRHTSASHPSCLRATVRPYPEWAWRCLHLLATAFQGASSASTPSGILDHGRAWSHWFQHHASAILLCHLRLRQSRIHRSPKGRIPFLWSHVWFSAGVEFYVRVDLSFWVWFSKGSFCVTPAAARLRCIWHAR